MTAAVSSPAGVFVAVVGPSGAGKDSVMDYARERLPQGRVCFVRRVITRPPDGGSEDHDSIDAEAFRAAVAEGAFAVSWEAHGLCYGLPVGLEDDLRSGRVVVANLSRGALGRLCARYRGVVVVEVTARPEIIAGRLAGRGRETAAEIARRLERRAASVPEGTVSIDNSGALAEAGERFLQLLDGLAAERQTA